MRLGRAQMAARVLVFVGRGGGSTALVVVVVVVVVLTSTHRHNTMQSIRAGGGAVSSLGIELRGHRTVGAEAAPSALDRGTGSPGRWGQPRAERSQRLRRMEEG